MIFDVGCDGADLTQSMPRKDYCSSGIMPPTLWQTYRISVSSVDVVLISTLDSHHMDSGHPLRLDHRIHLHRRPSPPAPLLNRHVRRQSRSHSGLYERFLDREDGPLDRQDPP